VNIHSRLLHLCDGLFLTGFTEFESLKNDSALETNEFDVESSMTTSIIHDLLGASISTSDSETNQISQRIFVLNYRYPHTLNSFLFHMTEQLQMANVNICIVTQSTDESRLKLPQTLGNLNILAPPSFKNERKFLLVSMAYVNGVWKLEHSETQSI
jgi:hypothetical protein